MESLPLELRKFIAEKGLTGEVAVDTRNHSLRPLALSANGASITKTPDAARDSETGMKNNFNL